MSRDGQPSIASAVHRALETGTRLPPLDDTEEVRDALMTYIPKNQHPATRKSDFDNGNGGQGQGTEKHGKSIPVRKGGKYKGEETDNGQGIAPSVLMLEALSRRRMDAVRQLHEVCPELLASIPLFDRGDRLQASQSLPNGSPQAPTTPSHSRHSAATEASSASTSILYTSNHCPFHKSSRLLDLSAENRALLVFILEQHPDVNRRSIKQQQQQAQGREENGTAVRGRLDRPSSSPEQPRELAAENEHPGPEPRADEDVLGILSAMRESTNREEGRENTRTDQEGQISEEKDPVYALDPTSPITICILKNNPEVLQYLLFKHVWQHFLLDEIFKTPQTSQVPDLVRERVYTCPECAWFMPCVALMGCPYLVDLMLCGKFCVNSGLTRQSCRSATKPIKKAAHSDDVPSRKGGIKNDGNRRENDTEQKEAKTESPQEEMMSDTPNTSASSLVNLDTPLASHSRQSLGSIQSLEASPQRVDSGARGPDTASQLESGTQSPAGSSSKLNEGISFQEQQSLLESVQECNKDPQTSSSNVPKPSNNLSHRSDSQDSERGSDLTVSEPLEQSQDSAEFSNEFIPGVSASSEQQQTSGSPPTSKTPTFTREPSTAGKPSNPDSATTSTDGLGGSRYRPQSGPVQATLPPDPNSLVSISLPIMDRWISRCMHVKAAPLHLACWRCDPASIRVLLRHGAAVTLLAEELESPDQEQGSEANVLDSEGSRPASTPSSETSLEMTLNFVSVTVNSSNFDISASNSSLEDMLKRTKKLGGTEEERGVLSALALLALGIRSPPDFSLSIGKSLGLVLPTLPELWGGQVDRSCPQARHLLMEALQLLVEAGCNVNQASTVFGKTFRVMELFLQPSVDLYYAPLMPRGGRDSAVLRCMDLERVAELVLGACWELCARGARLGPSFSSSLEWNLSHMDWMFLQNEALQRRFLHLAIFLGLFPPLDPASMIGGRNILSYGRTTSTGFLVNQLPSASDQREAGPSTGGVDITQHHLPPYTLPPRPSCVPWAPSTTATSTPPLSSGSSALGSEDGFLVGSERLQLRSTEVVASYYSNTATQAPQAPFRSTASAGSSVGFDSRSDSRGSLADSVLDNVGSLSSWSCEGENGHGFAGQAGMVEDGMSSAGHVAETNSVRQDADSSLQKEEEQSQETTAVLPTSSTADRSSTSPSAAVDTLGIRHSTATTEATTSSCATTSSTKETTSDQDGEPATDTNSDKTTSQHDMSTTGLDETPTSESIGMTTPSTGQRVTFSGGIPHAAPCLDGTSTASNTQNAQMTASPSDPQYSESTSTSFHIPHTPSNSMATEPQIAQTSGATFGNQGASVSGVTPATMPSPATTTAPTGHPTSVAMMRAQMALWALEERQRRTLEKFVNDVLRLSVPQASLGLMLRFACIADLRMLDGITQHMLATSTATTETPLQRLSETVRRAQSRSLRHCCKLVILVASRWRNSSLDCLPLPDSLKRYLADPFC
ncbi:serine-rich adhesin for platelets-like isoform X2 [Littorina saxatilis]